MIPIQVPDMNGNSAGLSSGLFEDMHVIATAQRLCVHASDIPSPAHYVACAS